MGMDNKSNEVVGAFACLFCNYTFCRCKILILHGTLCVRAYHVKERDLAHLWNLNFSALLPMDQLKIKYSLVPGPWPKDPVKPLGCQSVTGYEAP